MRGEDEQVGEMCKRSCNARRREDVEVCEEVRDQVAANDVLDTAGLAALHPETVEACSFPTEEAAGFDGLGMERAVLGEETFSVGLDCIEEFVLLAGCFGSVFELALLCSDFGTEGLETEFVCVDSVMPSSRSMWRGSSPAASSSRNRAFSFLMLANLALTAS